MERSDVVRPLGHIEIFSSSRHSLGLYRGIANACQYVVPARVLQSSSLEAAVESALARTILRLGALRVGIIDEDTKQPCFIGLPSVNLREIIEWSDAKQGGEPSESESEVLRVMEQRLDQAWYDMHIRPPWKLIVVKHGQAISDGKDTVILDVVFAIHHALCDGKSTALFHTVLLEELNAARESPAMLKNHVLSFHHSPVLTPSQEELVKFRISWIFLFKQLWGEFGPAWLKGPTPERPWTGKVITLSPNRLNLRSVTIASDVVPLLLAACRSHNTTLTALLHALILCSVSGRVPADAGSSFTGGTAISLQPFARVPSGVSVDLPSVITDMNTAMQHRFSAELVAELRTQSRRQDSDPDLASPDTEALMWRSAEAVRAELKKKVGTLPDDDITGLLGWVSDWRKRWLGLIGQPRDDTWIVSNIGSARYNGAGSGSDVEGWRIRRSLFAQPAMVVGPAFGVNVAGVDGGVITLTLNWQEGIVETDLIEGIAGDLQTWFSRLRAKGTF